MIAYRQLSTVSRGRLSRLFSSPSCSKPFVVLALESSADDTCAAIVSSNRTIHSNIVLKQNHIHQIYAGIHPHLAILSHTEQMPFTVRRALDTAQMQMNDIDAIAFTQGPGMGGCLAVACNAAKTLAIALEKPLVGVNHMRAHALTVTLTNPEVPPFPHLTLLVSGGHTMLVLVHSEDKFELIAQTADEAIGCTFDRVAALLGLEWGKRGLGAALEHLASTSDTLDPSITLPTMMPGQLEFSFCGLRAATKRIIDHKQRSGELSDRTRADIAARFQQAAVMQLEDKLARAVKECRVRGVQPRAVVASGGVATNLYLRTRYTAEAAHAGTGEPLQVFYPPLELCTDNAVMIAWAAMGRLLKRERDGYGIRPLAGWKIDMDRPQT
ncbi:peptidase M22 glycoprotease [Dacryopinax primogenitus]|uniref:N(6)-L-threonylcarbamoyladenine synthase n=1 Tax=Dacryopinax primogenitus (strain DJM 731) TaxID=1858805 RepID=M5FW97_DACPD|nr:peptidase M22 glycoprotease [Dacryopinax primogenitus]EJU00644.1 peptidase M22 glycoprotease [Dacryopinax primogenitus]